MKFCGEFPELRPLSRWVARVTMLAALLFVAVGSAADNPVTDLKANEELLFYPTLATKGTNGGWDVRIHGCVFEVERRRVSLGILRVALRLDGFQMNQAEAALFKERARLFFADNERGHRVVIRLAGQTCDLGKSAANGHFEKQIHLAALPDVASNAASGPAALEFSAVLKAGDERNISGSAIVLPARGVSVISDIDDTIKISDVLDHRALLRRTFLEPYETVPGMAEVYREWAAAGAQFHYVSASPWQLYPLLQDFMQTNAFVPGAWQMKQWRLKDGTFKSLFEDSETYKVETIAPLLRQFPGRRFVLVGDSGERDPEAYATLAREFPTQVLAIYIRDVTGQGADAERYATTFAGLPDNLWHVFREPSQIGPLPK